MRTLVRKFALAFAALMLAPTGQAATYKWDVATGDGAVLTDGTGTWSVGTPNWNVGGVDQNWADANDAIFGGGASGTAGAVTVGGTVVGPLGLFVGPAFHVVTPVEDDTPRRQSLLPPVFRVEGGLRGHVGYQAGLRLKF